MNTHTIAAPKCRSCVAQNIWGESCVNREYWLTHLEGGGGGGEGQRRVGGLKCGKGDEKKQQERHKGNNKIIKRLKEMLNCKREQQTWNPQTHWKMRDSPLISPGYILCVMSEAVSCATAPCSPYVHQSDCLPQNTRHIWAKHSTTLLRLQNVHEWLDWIGLSINNDVAQVASWSLKIWKDAVDYPWRPWMRLILPHEEQYKKIPVTSKRTLAVNRPGK